MLTPEENATRLNLYHQGLIDREIAERVGVNYRSIAFWRQQRKLPANGGGCGWGKVRERGSIPMERALTPDQCEDMRRFLSALVKYDDIARKAGRKLDVNRFMVEYREVYRQQETMVV
jgi:hypothetical protein